MKSSLLVYYAETVGGQWQSGFSLTFGKSVKRRIRKKLLGGMTLDVYMDCHVLLVGQFFWFLTFCIL